MKVKHYEIINPSDKVLVSADDDLVAAIAVLILADGRFGLCRDDGEQVLPVFLLGGAEEWLVEKGIADLAGWVREHALALAAVFDSAFYGDLAELRALEKALAGQPDAHAARQRYNDEKRTSMNNIGVACAWWANECREIARQEVRHG